LSAREIIGLIKAIDQFDTKREVKFETYAIALIRGAILEMLREEDWVPRSVRERVKALERTYIELEGRWADLLPRKRSRKQWDWRSKRFTRCWLIPEELLCLALTT
jgi:hypothetical protein